MGKVTCGLFLSFLSLTGALPGRSGTIVTLATFNGANGGNPFAGLTFDASGNLYGTTNLGNSSFGNVFEIASGTHAFSTLASFDNTNGANPAATLIADAAGNLYGTTANGGANGLGTVYKIAAGTHALTTLVTFNSANGEHPNGGLIADAAGNLYGTTYGGGAGGFGTVYKLAAGTHALTTLASMDNTNGANPLSRLVADAAGNLYGTAYAGGANNLGTVFKVAAGTNALSAVATFDGANNGAKPYAGMTIDTAGNLFGTTVAGGTGGYGTVFEIDAATHTLKKVAEFNNANGERPYGGLVIDAANNLFGTTVGGGGFSRGTAFKVAGDSHVLTTVATFNLSNGSEPYATLTADSNGNLYGAAYQGGSKNLGTVYEITGAGFITVPLPATFEVGVVMMAGVGLMSVGRRRVARG